MLKQAVILSLVVLFSMCNSDHKTDEKRKYVDYQKLKNSMQDSTGYFDPGFIKFRHLVLVFTIDNYEISDSIPPRPKEPPTRRPPSKQPPSRQPSSKEPTSGQPSSKELSSRQLSATRALSLPPNARIAVGKMPVMRSGGDFEVTYVNSSNVSVSYKMANPLYHRIEYGVEKGLVKVQSGSFEVPIPLDSSIVKVILKDNGVIKHVREFPLKKLK